MKVDLTKNNSFMSQLEKDMKDKSVLVIEDIPEVRGSMRQMMTSFGAKDIQEAPNGERALEKMRGHSFDVILCDYNLGSGKDGQQVLEEAKLEELITYSTIFIMVTAENYMGMVMGAIEFMPDDYLSKPFTKDTMKGRLQKLLDKKRPFKELALFAKQKDYKTAIALANKLIQEKKSVMDVLRIKMELSFQLEAYDEIKDFLEEVLSEYNVPWAKLGLGKVFYFKEDYVQAEKIFRELISENANYIHAYDWLAKTCHETGRAKEAQEVLTKGTAVSPKSLSRQKNLGEIAMENKDMAVAAKSFKAAVQYGKGSALRTPDEFTGLAKALTATGNEADAMKVIKNVNDEFRNNNDVKYQTGLLKSAIYRKQGLQESAEAALKEVKELVEMMDDDKAVDATMELAQVCMDMGSTEDAKQLLQMVVRNNHEDEGTLGKVQGMFEKAGMEDEGKVLIASTREEMNKLNNKGVQLVKAGKIDEAIGLFVKAADGAPENKTINLNAAQVLIMKAKKNKKDNTLLEKASEYLENAGHKDRFDEKYLALLDAYDELIQSRVVSGDDAASG
ncbi:MAG: tetratricopeptide repeat protein [Gammaproteobacteria bacterium]|nr:tetratricopeptide repeat protein [Gammaproteobacteria bacterium]MDH5594118.1 tetratricopeptide repeat protein [Gammaproteobacteria bacterium]